MKKFKIACQEMRCFEVEVEAENLDEAINKLQNDPTPYIMDKNGKYLEGMYVDDSFEINEDFTRDFLNEED